MIISTRASEHSRLRAENPDYDRTTTYFSKHGYSLSEYALMVSYGIQNNRARAKQAYIYVTCIVHLIVVLTHVTFGRAYEFVNCDWADTIVEKLDPSLEGPTPCYSLIIKVRPKQLGGLDSFYFVMPHIDPMRCLFWALGLVLFTYIFSPVYFFLCPPYSHLRSQSIIAQNVSSVQNS